jgi:hypothetical protein
MIDEHPAAAGNNAAKHSAPNRMLHLVLLCAALQAAEKKARRIRGFFLRSARFSLACHADR